MPSQKCLHLQNLNAISAAQTAIIITEKSTLAGPVYCGTLQGDEKGSKEVVIIFLIKGVKRHTSDCALNTTLYAKRILVVYCYCDNQTSKRK
jgi:hypothetical protein